MKKCIAICIIVSLIISCSFIIYKVRTNRPFIDFLPSERREFDEAVAATVKIVTPNRVGSGTIIYYDKQHRAYVLSAGHLWNSDKTTQIQYQGNLHDAEIIFANEEPGSDCSLLRFGLAQEPSYFPIAAVDYHMHEGHIYISLGCDHDTSPAAYEVEYIGVNKLPTVKEPVVTTIHNSPRPGRSGGGLIDGIYVLGVCFGTAKDEQTDYGFFTSLTEIHRVFKEKGQEWLLHIPPKYSTKRVVPKHSRPGTRCPGNYIPVPLGL